MKDVDNSEISRVLSVTYQKLIREAFLQINTETERIEFIESLNKVIGNEGFEYDDKKFTGNSGPTLE